MVIEECFSLCLSFFLIFLEPANDAKFWQLSTSWIKKKMPFGSIPLQKWSSLWEDVYLLGSVLRLVSTYFTIWNISVGLFYENPVNIRTPSYCCYVNCVVLWGKPFRYEKQHWRLCNKVSNASRRWSRTRESGWHARSTRFKDSDSPAGFRQSKYLRHEHRKWTYWVFLLTTKQRLRNLWEIQWPHLWYHIPFGTRSILSSLL